VSQITPAATALPASAGVICGTPRRYQTLAPTRKIATGAAMTLPRRGSATNLGAKAGSVDAAGVRRGSPRRYQTSRLTKKIDPRAQDTHLADRTSTAAAITTSPRANHLAQTHAAQLSARASQLEATSSQLPNPRLPSRTYQLAHTNSYLAPTNSQLAPTNSQLAPTNSRLPFRAYQLAPCI
jgi:hypothetical protein